MSISIKVLAGLSLILSLSACPPSTPNQNTPTAPEVTTSPEPSNTSSSPTEPNASSAPQSSPQGTPAASTEPNPGSTALPDENPSQPAFTVPANAAEIRVAVNNRFLNNVGETAMLSVQLLDSNGQVINAEGLPFRFASSNSLEFSVDEKGMITALKEFGFAEITVSLEGSTLTAVQPISVAAGGGSFGGGGGSSSGGGGSTSSGQSVTGNVMFENLERPD